MFDGEAEEHLLIVVKASFFIDGEQLTDTPATIILADRYFDDPLRTSLPGKPPSSQQRFDISTASLSCPEQPDMDADGQDDLLHLLPGRKLRFAGEATLYLSPGQYLTALSFDCSAGPEAPRDAIAGVLTMEMQTLQVVQ